MTATTPRTTSPVDTGYCPLPLRQDERMLGLHRRVVDTPLGPVVVREQAGAAPAAGDGRPPALVLLHGAAGSWTTWTPLLETADRLGVDLGPVVAIDLPGWGESPGAAAPHGRCSHIRCSLGRRWHGRSHGRSPARPHVSDPSVADAARAVAVVLRTLGHDEWRVSGHSLGGVIALELALAEPLATRSVGLVSPSGAAVLDAIRRPLLGGARLPAFAGMLAIMRSLGPVDAAGRALVRGVHGLGLLRLVAAPLFARPLHVDPSVLAALAHEVRPAAFAAAARAAGALDETRWRSIRCPVRAVHGDRDVFVGRTDARRLAAALPDLVDTVVAGAGHFAHVERPAEVLAALAGAADQPAASPVSSATRSAK